jgi:hypothetical protein
LNFELVTFDSKVSDKFGFYFPFFTITLVLPIPDPSEKETIISDGDILCPDRIPENVRTTIKMLRFISQKTI